VPTLPSRIVIATRESALALWQARHIEARLRALYPELDVAISGMTTEGDRKLGVSLAKVGGKGLFVKELEDALARGDADIAVHSMKDVPMDLLPGHVIGAVPERADPRDAFLSNVQRDLAELPPGARVGTSSLRRESQLRAVRPDLAVRPLRGNVPTRVRKLDEGEFDAIILAAAGLKRLGLADRITRILGTNECLPAVGQGALGIECRGDRADLLELLRPLGDEATAAAVRAERAVSRTLGASCTVPLAAYAEVSGPEIRVRAYVGAPDGTRIARADVSGAVDDAERVGVAAAEELRHAGAADILAGLDRTTPVRR